MTSLTLLHLCGVINTADGFSILLLLPLERPLPASPKVLLSILCTNEQLHADIYYFLPRSAVHRLCLQIFLGPGADRVAKKVEFDWLG